jgi:hypothetical protein
MRRLDHLPPLSMIVNAAANQRYPDIVAATRDILGQRISDKLRGVV